MKRMLLLIWAASATLALAQENVSSQDVTQQQSQSPALAPPPQEAQPPVQHSLSQRPLNPHSPSRRSLSQRPLNRLKAHLPIPARKQDPPLADRTF